MTAKEIVKEKYPYCYTQKITRNGPFNEFYFLLWSDRSGSKFRLCDGDDNKPESAIWIKCKREILDNN